MRASKAIEGTLMLGYHLSDDESVENKGGILGCQFREGEIELEHDDPSMPKLVLPYRAKLEFGAPRPA